MAEQINSGPQARVLKATASAPSLTEGDLVYGSCDLSGLLRVTTADASDAVTIADGADVTQGAIADAAVITNTTGTVSAKLRGIVGLLASCISIGSNWMQVSIQNATLAVTQSGTWGIWGLGRTTLPSSVASAAQVQVLLDRYGRTYSIAPVLTVTSSAGTAITTNTNTSLVAAPSAGNHLRIHRLWAQNSSATGTWCYWGNGSGVKTLPFFLAQNQPFSMAVNGEWELSTATALFMNTATTGANVEWFVAHETLAD